MSDLRLTWNVFAADLTIASNDIAKDDGLETAVIVSLFTDRRARDTDALPGGQTDRRGYWGDALPVVENNLVGSRLWLLSREKQLPAVLVRAKEYALEALQWLLDDKVAQTVEVTASNGTRAGWLELTVVITRPTASPVEYRFNYTWAAQAARVA